MKKLFLSISIVFFIASMAFAQSPASIPYQAVARDASGNLLVNANICVQFRVFNAPSGGTLLYEEHQSTLTNKLGLFNVNVGTGTYDGGSSGTLGGVKWDSTAAYMEIGLDLTNHCSGYITMGRSQMMSVPYALYAANVPAGSVTANNGLNVNTGNNVELGGTLTTATTIAQAGYNMAFTGGNVGIGTASPNTKLDINGSVMVNAGFGNSGKRPAIAVGTLTNGELRAYSSSGAAADDGFIRISAGGGTSAGVKSYIDLTGYSTVTDMNENIVLGTAGTERMRINSSGNVGIGITTPNSTLHVAGSLGALTDWGILVVADNNVSGSNGLSFGYDNTNNWGWMYARTTGNTGRTININNDVYATWSGGTGIGTSTPKSELDVKGGVSVGSYAGANAAPSNGMIVSGNVGIGNNTPNAQAILDLTNGSGTSSTPLTMGFVLPTTTTAPTTPVKGMTFYNSTTNCLQYWNGSAWINVVTSGGPSTAVPTWVTNPSISCPSVNTSYVFNSVSGTSYQVMFTGTGNTVNSTNATVTPLTVTASAATTTLTINAVTPGTLSINVVGCPGNNAQLTQAISTYGANIVDASSIQLTSITTTGANEIIIIDYGTYKSGAVTAPPKVNGSTTGVTAFSANGENSSNGSLYHYDWYYLAATAGTYTLADASGLSEYWAISNMAIKNTCGNALSASNIHQGSGTGWSYNAGGGSATITTTQSVPIGAFLAAGTYDDGGSNGSPSWAYTPQYGWAAYGWNSIQYNYDGDDDTEQLGGATVTYPGTQTVYGNNSGNNGGGFAMNVFWIQYP